VSSNCSRTCASMTPQSSITNGCSLPLHVVEPVFAFGGSDCNNMTTAQRVGNCTATCASFHHGCNTGFFSACSEFGCLQCACTL
jgi:hypothetical protein